MMYIMHTVFLLISQHADTATDRIEPADNGAMYIGIPTRSVLYAVRIYRRYLFNAHNTLLYYRKRVVVATVYYINARPAVGRAHETII